jgi:hypothetical protein
VAGPQIVQRGIGLRERIARYLHFDAGARRVAQELVPVFAREIGDGNELAFLPQKPLPARARRQRDVKWSAHWRCNGPLRQAGCC